MKKKLISFLLGMLCCVYLVQPVAAYSRSNAISYADTWAKARNTSLFNDYGGSDCTNFVSQCLYAGGLTSDDTWWYRKTAVGISESTTWRQASSLRNYFISTGKETKIGAWAKISNISPSGYAYVSNSSNLTASNTGKVVVFYDWYNDGVVNHSAFYVANNTTATETSLSSKPIGDLIDQHSNDRKRVIWHLDEYNANRATTVIYAYELSV